jgi:small subunit ribosomal protein S9
MNEKKNILYTKGRRKTATAMVTKNNVTLVNKKSLAEYFKNREDLIQIATTPLSLCNLSFNFRVSVKGGGIHAQAEAVRVGVARLISSTHPEFTSILNPLMRFDTRQVERKKAGFIKARKEAPNNKR